MDFDDKQNSVSSGDAVITYHECCAVRSSTKEQGEGEEGKVEKL